MFVFLTTCLTCTLLLLSSFVYAEKPLSDPIKQLLDDELVWVEGGTFDMGSNSPAARPMEQPVHKVTLDGFYIGQTEVTQGLYFYVMGWNNSYFQCERCPVNNISWKNAQEFIQKLNKATDLLFRLPTEAEWEFAAKGGNRSKNYVYSGSNTIADVAWFAGNAKNKSHQVKQKKPNELGLYDMTGNLWEFCQDGVNHHAYTKEPRNNPLVQYTKNIQKTTMKVLRGSGYEFSAEESQVFKRDGATSNVRMPDIGFRLALTRKPK